MYKIASQKTDAKKKRTNPVEIDQSMQIEHQLKEGSTNFDSEDRFSNL